MSGNSISGRGQHVISQIVVLGSPHPLPPSPSALGEGETAERRYVDLRYLNEDWESPHRVLNP